MAPPAPPPPALPPIGGAAPAPPPYPMIAFAVFEDPPALIAASFRRQYWHFSPPFSQVHPPLAIFCMRTRAAAIFTPAAPVLRRLFFRVVSVFGDRAGSSSTSLS